VMTSAAACKGIAKQAARARRIVETLIFSSYIFVCRDRI
jgi:hypothetical protein